eukprot:scaffold19.g1868.t1
MATARPYHVVIWGATGFTGRLVAEHLSRDYKASQRAAAAPCVPRPPPLPADRQGGEVKWALAGRDQTKLEKLRLELSEAYGADIRDVPILTGDLTDQSSLDKIASATRVILTTAGPFLRLGGPLVAAAVRNGSHYVDITGEIPYVRKTIDAHHEDAARKGLRIVPCCGYDSIPFDLGAFLVVEHLRQQGKAAAKVVNALWSSAGGVSGGTVASGFEVVNARIVHRSAYLLDYGPRFSYREAVGAKSWLSARAVQLGTLALGAAFTQSWLHPLLKRTSPAQGKGPSRKVMLGGHYKHVLLGYSAEPEGGTPTVVRAEVCDPHRDYGYWGTARMVLEAALCLALEQEELDADPRCVKGGVLTAASAMGSHLIERLRKAGIKYERLLRDQLEVVKVKQPDGSTRYSIKPLETELSFDKGFYVFIRALQLLTQHNKDTIVVPIYDFKESARVGYRTVPVPESRVVIVEGIYALHQRLRPLLDLRVSITGGVHFDLVKRVLRDIDRSGQAPEDIIQQARRCICVWWGVGISDTVYPMYKAFIEPDLRAAHLRVLNTFNPFSGFMSPTYILKSAKPISKEKARERDWRGGGGARACLGAAVRVRACGVLAPGYTSVRQSETYDIYLLPPNEDPESCQSWLRMRCRDGRYSLMFEEWVVEGEFIISPRVTFEVPVRILGGLMALGYEIGTIMQRATEVLQDDRLAIKFDHIEGMDKVFIQLQGKDREVRGAVWRAVRVGAGGGRSSRARARSSASTALTSSTAT